LRGHGHATEPEVDSRQAPVVPQAGAKQDQEYLIGRCAQVERTRCEPALRGVGFGVVELTSSLQ